MNASLRTALKVLRPSVIENIRAELGILLGGQGIQETNSQYVIRFLRKVEGDGKIRELEQALLQYQ